MNLPKRFSGLPEYAFPRLRSLLDGVTPGGDVLHMSIGEPRHPMPSFVKDVLTENLAGFAKYPANDGTPDLQNAIAAWFEKRFAVALDPTSELMALNGTREGLFNAVLALCPEEKNGKQPKVLMPNPFYQVYAVGSAAAGAEPVFVPATEETGFLPNFAALPKNVLDQTAIVFICSPSNPQGAVADRAYLKQLLALAEAHDFLIFADECYSEIYDGDAPAGLLEIANEVGADRDRLLVFHSLSKRSNLPGLRSGFVAGGARLIAEVKQLRAYAGAPLPGPLQAVAAAVWSDEDHVIENRRLYREKYELARNILGGIDGLTVPRAGFFLWLPVPDGEKAALDLWSKTGVRVLPGAYLSRKIGKNDPGHGYIRAAMVASLQEVERGLSAIRACIYEGADLDV